MTMVFLGWIVFGLLVGMIAKVVMPGKDPGGPVGTTVIGLLGAVIGGYLGRQAGLYEETDPVSFLMAVLGAVALLVLYRWLAT